MLGSAALLGRAMLSQAKRAEFQSCTGSRLSAPGSRTAACIAILSEAAWVVASVGPIHVAKEQVQVELGRSKHLAQRVPAIVATSPNQCADQRNKDYVFVAKAKLGELETVGPEIPDNSEGRFGWHSCYSNTLQRAPDQLAKLLRR